MEIINTFDDHKAAFGIFRKRAEITSAKSALQAMGFSRKRISVLYPPHGGNQDFPEAQRTSVRTGAIMGGGIGAFVLAIVGMIVGVQLPLESIRFSGDIGNISLMVLAFLVAGAVLGAGAGALVGIGTPQTSGNRYGDYVDHGGILMSVRVENAKEAQDAREALERNGAQDISLLREDTGWERVYTKVAEHTI
jgi:hypothetical protein